VYFIVNINKKKFEKFDKEKFEAISKDHQSDHALLYGVSCFKQILVTEKMKEHDPDLTRSHVQKAVCILSKVPVFGYILAKLDPITKCYFMQDNFNDTEVFQMNFDVIFNFFLDA